MRQIWLVCLVLLTACGSEAIATPEVDLQATIAALETEVAAPGGAVAQATVTVAPLPGETTVIPPVSVPTLPAPLPTIDPNLPAFYVATDGNDEGGDGSATAPWATITHALDSVPDGSLILVRPGLYTGRVRIRGLFSSGVTVRSELPYQAQLRADETVLTIFEAQGITIEGFDVAHLSPAAGPIVVQIQDAIGDEPGGDQFTSRITLRNNILHDSYNNDILKINNGAQQIWVEGNIFYNQGDSDEHIDINSVRDVVIEDNIFFNSFAGSGRTVSGESSSFVVAKDSNGNEDGIVGVDGLIIRQNIFFHYEGSSGHNMLLLGEDGNEYYEVSNALIENNLFLGDGGQVRSPFGTKGVHQVIFRHNTISGDMPAGAFVWRSNIEGDNQPNDNIWLYNNLFSDPAGTMDNFATAPEGETAFYLLVNNLYWNGGQPIPESPDEMIHATDDAAAILGNPFLNVPTNLLLPLWNPQTAQFGGGATDIRAAFTQLVQAYAIPQAGSVAIDAADASQMSSEDILGQARSGAADIGAYEVQGNETVLILPTVEPAGTEPAGTEATDTPGNEPISNLSLPALTGWVTFAIQEGDTTRIYRLPLSPNAIPEDMTAVIRAVSPGQYTEWLNISANGSWYILSADGFDPECNGWPCLIITQDFVTYEVLKSGGAAVHAEYGAISNDGSVIVYRAGDGTHGRDIWAIHRQGATWSNPIELTTTSPFGEHQPPTLAGDGSQVVFACGDDPYAANALCTVNSDGSDFQVRFLASANGGEAGLYHPVFAPDGSLVFEGDWNGEQLWRLPAGSQTPILLASPTNDNSPCVLPNGLIVSLWLGRVNNENSYHELKVMSADGQQYMMLLIDYDLFDIGMGCGSH